MIACLDSSAYIEMIRGNRAVANYFATCEELVVPAAVVAELTEGFCMARNADSQAISLGRFLDRPNIRLRAADYSVAVRYGFIARQLRRKGTPLPVNDVWIAATALEEGASIISYDRHFDVFDLVPRIAP